RNARARVPVLLALPYAPAVLRANRLVRSHDAGEGSIARCQRLGALVPVPHPTRAVRQLAGEQRRLGTVARTVLGHAPADLAMRTPARPGGRVAHRAERARGPGPDGTRSAQARYRRGDFR